MTKDRSFQADFEELTERVVKSPLLFILPTVIRKHYKMRQPKNFIDRSFIPGIQYQAAG